VDETSDLLKEERRLVRAIRKGDQSAWGEIYSRYAPLLYRRVLMPRLANPTAAEDALSETFRLAIERIDQYEERESGLYPWLARIASNKAMDMHRARAMSGRKITDLTEQLLPFLKEVSGADELLECKVEERFLSATMATCLDRLNPRYKKVLELRFLEEKDRKSCADAMEVSIGTLDVLVLRALRALKKTWDEVPGGPKND
jgi:RNA polymerase sigma-70 factor (ECF subfamily)